MLSLMETREKRPVWGQDLERFKEQLPMTEIAPETPTEIPLGVGALISDSFSVLISRFLPILVIFFLPDFLVYWLTVHLNENTTGFTDGTSLFDGSDNAVATALSVLFGFIVLSLETALFAQLAYDAKLGQPVRFGKYLRTLAANLLPVLVLSFVVLLLLIPAYLALLIPGFWVQAVFIAVVPAIVTERCGFRALRRSAELTRDYRWPIAGALLLAGIFSGIVDSVAKFLSQLVFSAGNALLESLVYVSISGIGYAFLGILAALVYARLREIKEGIGMAEIVAVFD
ncbi:hypothetical protein [Roseibium sp. M-1]